MCALRRDRLHVPRLASVVIVRSNPEAIVKEIPARQRPHGHHPSATRIAVVSRRTAVASLTWGNSSGGLGTSRKSHSGAHPSRTSKTSSFEDGHVGWTVENVSFEDLDGVVAVLEPTVEDAVPYQSVDHVEPVIDWRSELSEPLRNAVWVSG